MEPLQKKDFHRDTLAIIGLGKVGTAVGVLLLRAGYSIAAVADTSPMALERVSRFSGSRVFQDCAPAAALANCILITTQDDQIAPVCDDLCLHGAVQAGDKVIHMSGAGGLDLLDAAHRIGAHVASIHPIQSFADVEGAIANIPGSTFGITSEPTLHDWTLKLVRDLGGTPFFVAEKDKTLYHAAACMASNYLTTLMYMVEEMYRAMGVEPSDALQTFWPLVRGTIRNIEARGTLEALTGPIARGDVGTLRKHISSFRNKKPSFLELYCLMGLMTVELSARHDTQSPEKIAEMKSILKGGLEDEHARQIK